MSNPTQRQGLIQDWHRYYDCRPGFKAVCVALAFDPGFSTVFLFRLAQRLTRKGSRVRARLVHRLNMILSSCELNPEAEVEAGLYLPHPSGVTIGKGSRVGRDVTLFQGVVLGARGAAPAYPLVEQGAVLYPHVLASGEITIGRNASVLGNSVVTRDVPEGELHGGAPAERVRSGNS